MEKTKIFGLVGELASGKGAVSQYLKEKYSASTYRFSTPMRDVLNRLHIPLTRENLQDVSTILRERFGQDLFVNAIAEDALEDKAQIKLIEGIRLLVDIERLRKLPNFKLIHIKASVETRYKRLTERGENTDDHLKTFEEFQKDHLKETEIQIPKVAALADYIIENEGGLDELKQKIDNIIQGGF
jgi:dephospho-CoA kinase